MSHEITWNFDALPEEEKLVIAMEVFEAIENIRPAYSLRPTEPIEVAFNRFGYARMRLFAAGFCAPAWEAWVTRDVDRFDSCFDWCWLPEFLKACVNWDGTYGPCLYPDWPEIAAGFEDPMTQKPVMPGAATDTSGEEMRHG